MIRPKLWTGEDLEGKWIVTLKLDGVRCIIKNGEAKSRSNKPLYHIPKMPDGDYEVFVKDWNTTVSRVRTVEGKKNVFKTNLYSLDPLDKRLLLPQYTATDAISINKMLMQVVSSGCEGLVLRQGKTWLKVKPEEHYDVVVTRCIEGKGRNKGRLGAFMTSMGKVGTGLSDEQREHYKNAVGITIEVACMSVTKAGKFRHPRFIRERWDK